MWLLLCQAIIWTHAVGPPLPADHRTGKESVTTPMTAPLTPKGKRTRQRILDVSMKLFAQSGSNSTSLRGIAAEAGLSHAGVLRYFQDKDALLIAVLEHRDEMDLSRALDEQGNVRAEVLTGNGPYTALRTLLEVVERNATMPGVVELFLKVATEATHEDHPAHDYFLARYARLRRLLEPVFAAVLPDEPPAGITAAEATEQLISILDGSQLQWLLSGGRIDLVADARRYLELLGIDLADPAAD